MLATTLGGLCVALFVALCLVAVRLKQCRSANERFEAIVDVEAHLRTCEEAAELAKQQKAAQEVASKKSLQEHLELQETKQKLTSQIKGFQQVVGNFKVASDLETHLKELRAQISDAQGVVHLKSQAERLNSQIQEQQVQLSTLQQAIDDAKTANEIKAKVVYYENLVSQLEKDVDELVEAKQMQEFAFYRPRFDFDLPDTYEKKLRVNRDQQKVMLKTDSAAKCSTEWEVSGSRAKGRQMEKQKTMLMLRAFNGECDAAIAKATYRNAESLGKRIEKAFNAINKLSSVNQIEILRPYLDLKLDELYLTYEWQVKKQEQKEEQAEIKRQMREEQKAEREAERIQNEADKEARAKEKELASNEKALEIARAELEEARQKLAAEGSQIETATEGLKARAQELEEEHDLLIASLQEALERKAKAISRAQQTRSGHVYVLSNVGSFGPGCFKIGMSRRFEPLERVKELGSASVPFPFDVHAMIYTEDAPDLEKKLHRRFENKRVNLVNSRKEFFKVSLQEIVDAVHECHGEVTFKLNAEAADYRQTVNRLREEGKDAKPLSPPVEVELV